MNINDVFVFLNVFVGDMTEADELIAKDSSSFNRRTYIRSSLSLIEACTWQIKQACLMFNSPNRATNLSDKDREFLKEKNAKGKNKFTPIYESIIETNILFNKVFFGSNINLELEKQPGQCFLKKAIEIRNNITHPKQSNAYIISDEHIEVCRKTTNWYSDIVLKYIDELKDHQRIYDEFCFIELNGIDYDEEIDYPE